MKLPNPLGSEIHKKFKEQQTIQSQLDNIATRIHFIVSQLVEKCKNIKITS